MFAKRDYYVCLLSLISLMSVVHAEVPDTIAIHGQLLDDAGMPLTGTRAYRINFYDVELDGIPIGAHVGTIDLSMEGVFNIPVTLIEVEKLASVLWYEIAVDSNDSGGIDEDDWFPNRIKVESVPFALQAATVESIPMLEGVTTPVQEQLDAKADGAALTDHANNISNPHNVTAAQLGLENVDNTADLDKPISNAVQVSQDAQDAVIAGKAEATDVYTKTEVDAKLFSWETVVGTAQQMEPNHGYVVASSEACTLTLPPSANLAVGDTVRVNVLGEGGCIIAQNESQSVYIQAFEISRLETTITWTPRESGNNWQGIACSDDGTKVVACVGGGQLYTSTDSGATWTARESSRIWHGVASSSDGTKLVAVATVDFMEPSIVGGIYISTDAGVTWTAHETARDWVAIASSADGAKLVAAEQNGHIYTSNDSGANWTQRDSARNWRAVASCIFGSKLAATVNGGQIYTSTDSGASWNPRESERAWCDIVSDISGTKLAATVSGGQIYTSTDSGVTWMPRDSNRGWYGIACSGYGNTLLACAAPDEYAYVSLDSGLTWTATGDQGLWIHAAMSADGTKLFATDMGNQIYTGILEEGSVGGYLSQTTPGASGQITAEQGHSIELLYVGNDMFSVISYVGASFGAQ